MTMRVSVQWQGDRATRGLSATLHRRMQRGAALVQADARRLVSTPYPPASRPGQPPRRRTGRLMNSIVATVSQRGRSIVLSLTARVRYARFLELGTVRMAARPFLMRAMRSFVGARFGSIMRSGR